MAVQRVPVAGSDRAPVPGHVRVGEIDTTARASVSVYLAPRAPLHWVDAEAARPPRERRTRTRAELAEAHGADPAHVQALQGFAAEHGLELADADPARRRVALHGSVGALAAAFEAQLDGMYAPAGDPAPARAYRARSGPLTVPGALAHVVSGVFGLDDRPQARPQIRFAAAGAAAYTPPQVAAAYAYPAGTDGTGETVAIIELGGGYREADLAAYFASLKLAVPSVTAVAVDGGANTPGTDTDADGEVMLDIEVVGSVAPKAQIVVYFAPNTDQGFLDAVSAAVHSTAHPASVVSISWGGPEESWTAQARTQMEQVLTAGAALGVTVTVAAGDGGSSDGQSDGKPHVDFPASAPHALACGGTTLELRSGAIASETVWETTSDGATGGGVSVEFPLPSYQSKARVPDNASTGKPGRGVPDVAGDANPQTGYTIRVDGSTETIGGTSAVAPLWAALVARLNQHAGAKLGFLQPRLYPLLQSAAFHDITSGSNGAYSAGPGWDACSGLGSPDGTGLAAKLGG